MDTEQARIQITIRPFDERDYPGLVAVRNAVFPDRPGTVEEARYDDEHFDKKFAYERYVAQDLSGTIVGYSEFWQVPWAYHPQKFDADIKVHPQAQRRGIGSALWAHLEERLRARRALTVKVRAWEQMPAAIRFAQRRGFREVLRSWESRLAVAAFDPAGFAPQVDGALRSGVTITTLEAERARDPASLARIHAMEAEIAEDVPRPADDVHTPIEFSMWQQYAVEAPWAINEAFFLAVVEGEYAGLSSLFRPKIGDWLNQGLTGVRRPFRGRHIATALKVKTVEYARAQGIREIRTWNEVNNAAMLAINTQFGFVRQPAWITLGKEYEATTPRA